MLGVVDHGTRALLALQALERKTTVAVLRALLDLVERFGRPAMLRTDNEATFTARLFRLALFVLGIHHQRTEPFAPWQNGRVERFFGTFKRSLRQLREEKPNAPLGEAKLRAFRLWYNGTTTSGLTKAWKGLLPPKHGVARAKAAESGRPSGSKPGVECCQVSMCRTERARRKKIRGLLL